MNATVKNLAIKNGLFLGAALVVGTIAFILVSPRGFLSYGNWALFLIAVLIMVKTANDVKSELGGFASFGQLFTPILITVAIGYFLRVAIYYIMANFVSPELVEIQKEISVEALEAMSGLLGEEMMDQSLDAIEEQNVAGIGSLAMQYVSLMIGTGGIVNAIICAVFKNEKPLIDRV